MAKYTADEISVLEGLEPVRKRPGMYIGGVGSAGLHHLVWEILDNSIDEAMNGHADDISVTLSGKGRIVTVTDNGRGIPVDTHKKLKKPALEVILTTLHAGGKFGDGGYRTAGGLHGVGASVVNALSIRLMAQVRRDGSLYTMEFERGKVSSKLKRVGAARGSGTRITFEPDPTIFQKIAFDAKVIRERLQVASYLHRGVKFQFDDQVNGEKVAFQHERGIEDYVARLVEERDGRRVHEEPFVLSMTGETRIEAVIQWTQATDELFRSYVNGIPTGSGGTHENGLKAGIGKAVRNFIETHKLTPKGVTVTAEDIREGLVCVLSIFITDPQFQGQTKDRLNNPELQSIVDQAIRQDLETWLNGNRSVAEGIVERIVLAARARAASRAASLEVKRKSPTKGRLNLPGKLTDCTSQNSEETEIFIVEGDSAGGTAKQGRDRATQAILPLRGKVLNTEGLPLSKVLANKEISDLITALGCGVGKTVNLGNLRYGRVILLADADSDGHHITTLLLTFFYRHLRELIDAGRLFIARPPLYRINHGKKTFWAADEAARDRILEEHVPGGNAEITRFKGLGEMPADTLWQTTIDPRRRRLYKVQIRDTDRLKTDETFTELMGKDASARYEFIMNRAETADALDL